MKLVQSPRASSKTPMPQSGEEPGGENAASKNTGETGPLTAMFEVTHDDVDVEADHVPEEALEPRGGCVPASWQPRCASGPSKT